MRMNVVRDSVVSLRRRSRLAADALRGRVLIALTAAGAVCAVAFLLAGGWTAVFMLAIATVFVSLVTVTLLEPGDAAFVVRSVVFVFVARAAATAVLHLILTQQSPGGAMFQDDLGYVQIADAFARLWHGQQIDLATVPFDIDPSTLNAYIRTLAGIFWLIGPNVVVAKLFNTMLAIIASLFVYRISWIVAGRPAARAALWIMLVFPSLALWSSLTLKEAFSLFCSVGVAWTIAEFTGGSRSRSWLIATALLVLPLQDTRAYLFTILLAALPLTLLALRALRGRPGMGAVVVVVTVVAFFLVSGIRPGLAPTSQTVGDLGAVRANMAEGARSAFVESTQQVQGQDADCFVVAIPGHTPEPGRSPAVVVVPSGTTLIYARRQTTDVEPPAGSVPVVTGDIACIGREPTGGALSLPTPSLPVAAAQPSRSAAASPLGTVVQTPAATPSGSATPSPAVSATPSPSVSAVASPSPTAIPVLSVSQTGSTRLQDVAAPAPSSAEGSGGNSLSYLPRGIAFLIGAPFPWDLTSASRIALLPELFSWYMTVVLGIVGLVLAVRRRSYDAIFVLLVGLAIAGVLSLTEGNVGTLVRHRSMLVPFAAVFAGIGLGHLMSWRQRGARLPESLRL